MLQMSGKMWTTPLPAEPLRLENAFLEVRGSPDRIKKAHSICFSFLFLPCLAAVAPPCPPPPPPQTRVPYLPSHLRLPIALLYLTPGRPFTNSFCQLHLFERLESYQWEAWLRLPTAGAGSSLPGPCQALPLRRSPRQPWSGATATISPAQLHTEKLCHSGAWQLAQQLLYGTHQHSQDASVPKTLTPVTEFPYTALGRNHEKYQTKQNSFYSHFDDYA